MNDLRNKTDAELRAEKARILRELSARRKAARPKAPRKQRSTEERERARLYEAFSEEHTECWICRREAWQKPRWWCGLYLIERMHIVNKPRVEDVRVIIAACTLCHQIQHGARFRNAGDFSRGALTIEQLLALKREHDPANYDPEFLQKHSVRRLTFP